MYTVEKIMYEWYYCYYIVYLYTGAKYISVMDDFGNLAESRDLFLLAFSLEE